MIELMEFDCNSSKSRTLSRTVYSSTGSVIVENTINANFSDWDYIIPDSVGETLLGKVCELYN
ncbi:surface-adhesin E family protein [Flavobacterium laiguense]|uniref:surface-adhesin E family protein n=1 Tax=Flavobacterium laiguense TaxID=2169409 RepID=UPI000F4E7FC6|nr:surface-adhesin E family protein [Flavobacterium laiguense]